MAKMLPGFGFTGTLGNLSAYTMRGSDKIIIRTKGGGSKKKIKTSPSCINVRRNNAEFGGRSAAAKQIMDMLYPQKALADYNIAPVLNQLLVPVQKSDTVSAWGERNVILSKHPQLLEGFDLNRQTIFSSIIRHPLSCSLSREATTASIKIPSLIPGINFHVPGKFPLFSLVGTLGVVPDMTFTKNGYTASQPAASKEIFLESETEWFPSSKGSSELTLEFAAKEWPAGNDWSLMLCIGIRFGTIGNDGAPQQLKHAGAAKILAMA